MKTTEILNFFYELGHLKRMRHEGLRITGVEDPGTVGAHALRAAQIGYVLAVMEGYEDPNKVATILVFHDIGEVRVGDIHKVGRRYVTADEERAVSEQLDRVKFAKDSIMQLWRDCEEKSTQAGIIAKDADYLEQAITAKEFLEKGYSGAEDWIDNVNGALKTESARELGAKIKETHSNDWWRGLKKL